MKYGLNYDIDVSEYEDYIPPFSDIDIDSLEGGEYTYTIDENLNDVIDYMFIQKYNRPYENNLGWYLEDGAKEFVKDIEDKWWHNKLDTYTLYHDYKFLDYLTEKYRDEAIKSSLNDELVNYRFIYE